MRTSSSWKLTLICGVVALAARCAPSLPKPMDPLPRAEPGVAVETLWDARRDVVLKASKGKKFTLSQLTESVEFFEGITCLGTGHEPGPYGVIAKQVLRESLKRWDGWYAKYGPGLRVDDAGEIVGAPACP